MNKIIRCITWCLLLGIVVVSCSEDASENKPIPGTPVEIPVSVDTRALPAGLTCKLYLFRKESGMNTFILNQIVDYGNTDTQQLSFMMDDLDKCAYRLFFLVEPSVSQLIKTGLSLNNDWANMKLGSSSPVFTSSDYYYGMVTKTGTDMYTSFQVPLKRLVGQPLIDICKVEENDLQKPVNVSSEVTSVLDRVYKIEIAYTGLCTEIKFEGDNMAENNHSGTFIQTIIPNMEADKKVDLSLQSNIDKGLSVSGKRTGGSARIQGIFALPSKNVVKMRCTFSYYHTTPGYEDIKTIELNLPSGSTNNMSIEPNMYTLNNVGIAEDRIIDVSVNGGFSFDLKWESDI